MDLVEKIKRIAESEGIPESELILDEVEYFIKLHQGHGCYETSLLYDEKGLLSSLDLTCRATNISVKNHNHCDRDEFPTSIIYERDKDFEGDVEAQRERREKWQR